MYPIFPIYYNASASFVKANFSSIPYSNEKTAIRECCPKRAVCESNADNHGKAGIFLQLCMVRTNFVCDRTVLYGIPCNRVLKFYRLCR